MADGAYRGNPEVIVHYRKPNNDIPLLLDLPVPRAGHRTLHRAARGRGRS